MKTQKYNGGDTRTLLVGMITDPGFLARLCSLDSPPLFRDKWAGIIAKWCLKYYQSYHKAPGRQIQSVFNSWSGRTRTPDLVEPMERFLGGLSREYQQGQELNTDYLIDLAGQHFNRVRLEQLADGIQADLVDGKLKEAQTRVEEYHKLELGPGAYVNVFEDVDAIREAFTEHHQPLIQYTEGLGEFFGDRLERDGFVAFMGPEKRGKTFWLLDVAFRGVLQKRRVAFFEVGDMSQNQIMRRFMSRVSRRPLEPGPFKYPTAIRPPAQAPGRDDNGRAPGGAQDQEDVDLARVKHSDKMARTGLSWREAHKFCQMFLQGRKMKSLLRLSCHYNDTATVEDLRGILDGWARETEAWIPDIIVIDYADILRMDHYAREPRDRIDRCWKQLRRLSQEYHCLVLTATQSDAKSYDVRRLSKKHFSEDKRKHAHVTGMIGLNQTAQEKERALMRLNWIDLRERKYSERRCCYVAGCFEIANMAIRSVF
jgi:hypothetical protein